MEEVSGSIPDVGLLRRGHGVKVAHRNATPEVGVQLSLAAKLPYSVTTTHSQHNYFLRLRVLHIEDEAPIAALVLRLFQQILYAQVDIFHVSCLRDGLVALRDETWDCVLLDLTLPDRFGVETFHQIHGFTDVPIVVLTAEDNLERRAEVIAAGAQDCVYKMEMTSDLLIRSVRFAVERNHIVQELRVALKEVQAANIAMQEILNDSDIPPT